jgi:ferredoxin-NADP reductase
MTTFPSTTVVRDRIANLPRARLVERTDYTDDLMVIKMEPQDFDFNFEPGQYCTLGLDGIERAYSIVSAPHEPLLEIFVELVPDGELTPRMWRMEIGDTMSIRPRPKGLFLMDPSATQHLMLGTVTGTAPFVSIVRDHLHYGRDGHHFYVIEGASYLDEFVYDEELAQLAAAHPDVVTFVPAISRPTEERNAGWAGATGRLNNIVAAHLEKFGLDSSQTLIYACGHPGMIEASREIVTNDGWRWIEERFWKE